MVSYYFGLKKSNSLSEVADPVEALKNLNLDIKDLDKIRGIDSIGVEKTDLQTLSNLIFDAEKVTTALESESRLYENLTSNVFDKYSTVNTNIVINGSLAAAAYKYNFVNFDAVGGPEVRKADVSTSRVSSWSTLQSPATNNTPIFYGGNVNVEGPLELSNLTLNTRITTRKYSAEVPTHRLNLTVDGQSMFVYAMKGIPLSFNGFFNFANVFATVAAYPGSTAVKPSWVVRDTNVASITPIQEYIDIVGNNGNSAITFSRTSAVNRTIELYYPPAYITGLTLPRINLLEIPKVILPALETLNLNSNDLREFPDLSQFTALRTLDLSFNNLTRSTNSSLRTLSANVVSRMPTNLTSLTLGHTFGGAITGNLASRPLTLLNLSCSSFADRRFTGTSPAANSSTIQFYYMNFNRFSSIHNSILTAPNLVQISFNVSELNQSNIAFTSTVLDNISFSDIGNPNNNRVNVINVSGKTVLTRYNMTNLQFSNPVNFPNNVKSIFNGCSALQAVIMRNTNASGSLPDFVGCSVLNYVDFINTNISGSDSTTTNLYAINRNTFNACRSSLVTFYWESPNITSAGIEDGAFSSMRNLTNFYLTSRKAGLLNPLAGNLFNDCVGLVNVWYFNNRTTGSPPLFPNSRSLSYLNLTSNQFDGVVPNYTNKSNLRYVLLQNNLLTSFAPIETTSLWVLNLNKNKITGSIPNLSNLTSLQELDLGDNQFTSYTRGSFSGLTSIRFLNLNGNQLTQGAVDQILKDLNTNFTAAPRTGVTVNIRGSNAAPSTSKEITDIITKLKAFWTVSTNL